MISTRFNKKNLKRIRTIFASLHGRILDVGCGNMLDRVGFAPGDEYVGVDCAKSKYTVALADIHKLPFQSFRNSFQLATKKRYSSRHCI